MSPPNDDDPRGSSPDDDYLFDRSGVPDADVERLERVLRPIGTRDDAVVPAMATSPRRRVPLRVWATVAAAVFVALVVVPAVIWHEFVAPGFDAKYRIGTTVTVGADGLMRVATPPTAIVTDTTSGKPLTATHWVETTDAPRELTIDDTLARVTLGARSRLQVRQVSADTTRFYLERGSLEARVSADARPRFFQVDTDAARCVDLGCRYTLDVTDDGVATVRVTTGQVAFETETREVFIPAGAVCVARKGTGPGTPRFEDARDDVRAAFDAYDAAPIASAASPKKKAAWAALDTVRDARDTLPAWHLLQDHDPDVVHAAAARLEAVAGSCGAPAKASPAELRAAWKDHLATTCW